MEKLVIPNIPEESKRLRAVDELPQSAAGKTIMTTEPKFIPEEAAEITIGEHTHFRIRMVDCVGYILPSALGYIENDMPRMVKTPWFEEEVPFGMAAEVGTQKVITEHATVGLVVTTDGSITNLPRRNMLPVKNGSFRNCNSWKSPLLCWSMQSNPTADRPKPSAKACEKISCSGSASLLPRTRRSRHSGNFNATALCIPHSRGSNSNGWLDYRFRPGTLAAKIRLFQHSGCC